MLERETKREKIIEAKLRELKLKSTSTKVDPEVAKKKLAKAEAQMLEEIDEEFVRLTDNIVSIIYRYRL